MVKYELFFYSTFLSYFCFRINFENLIGVLTNILIRYYSVKNTNYLKND